ncbi:hypothetical protein MKX03_012703 [Papaver bracteatum]|nr:hypothetical protein MKX03_012703 [Papaver bracteatum]
MALNCLEEPLDLDIKNEGRVVVLNTKNFPMVEQVGLVADLVRIDGGSMCSPRFSCDSAYQVTYIVRGSGRAQIVSVDGKRKLEIRVEAEGMNWFSIISAPNPIFCHLAGRTSVWKALNPQVLEASFNVAPEAEKHFRSKRTNAEIFFPALN